jgi:hypothetical protein
MWRSLPAANKYHHDYVTITSTVSRVCTTGNAASYVQRLLFNFLWLRAGHRTVYRACSITFLRATVTICSNTTAFRLEAVT